MIPGKKYTPEEVFGLAWRYRWLIVVPFIMVTLATFIVSRWLPDRYRSETLILVVPQRVPETYVRSTVTARIEDRLQSISQQILSRTRLERIITDFNLYVEERRVLIMEDIVERMRRDIEVQIVKGDAFRVAYMGAEPRTVMKVTERLASLFIEENLRDREVLAEGASQFLEAQLDDARRQLIEHEQKLEAYRKQYDGQLPSQVDSNLQAIHSAELQLQTVTESLNRDRDQKMLLERQIADASVPETNAPAPPAPAVSREGDPAAPNGASAAQQLAAARASLQTLELRFKPEHPDVLRLKRLIRDLEQKAEAEVLEQPLSPGPTSAPISPAERARQNRFSELRIERENLGRAIESRQGDEKRLRAVIAEYQMRVAAAPTRESELVELTRDYDTLQKMYVSLLAKREDSKVSANLERRQIGEQFKILDPARLAERPFSPNRVLINAGGAVAGLALGVALVVLFEYRDSSLKTESDVTLALALPVLGLIPLMITTVEQRTQKRKRLIVTFATAAIILGGAAAVLMWKLRT